MLCNCWLGDGQESLSAPENILLTARGSLRHRRGNKLRSNPLIQVGLHLELIQVDLHLELTQVGIHLELIQVNLRLKLIQVDLHVEQIRVGLHLENSRETGVHIFCYHCLIVDANSPN